MSSIHDYSDEELGRLVKRAAAGREQEAAEAARSRSGLADFLEQVGLTYLAGLVKDAAVFIFHRFQDIIGLLFG